MEFEAECDWKVTSIKRAPEIQGLLDFIEEKNNPS